MNIHQNISKQITAIDLFCGAGGLTNGLEKSGIKVGLGIDIDPACEYPYSENNSGIFLKQSVTALPGTEIQRFYKKRSIRLLAGCPPCQTFSSHNRKFNDADDRWQLLLEFSRLIKETLPELVTMENVPGLLKKNIFYIFKSTLINLGYTVDHKVINCSEYGLPQNRQRLVLLASKFGAIQLLEPFHLIKKTSKTVREAIGNIEPIEAGVCSLTDSLHKTAELSPLNLERIKVSKPGGTWRDWPKSLVSNCHKKPTGEKFLSVYARMEWDKPSPTITTQFLGFSKGRFGHPEQNRALSLREGAILQGFPKRYKFTKKGEEPKNTIIGRLIGNAVPVTLGYFIGKSIVKHIREIRNE